jgi:hypothetical protein
MARNTSALRSQVESALAGRILAPFTSGNSGTVETVSVGIPEADGLIGGLPRGGITEIYGPSSSGRTSLLMSVLASRTAQEEACAFIDGHDVFDPYSAQGTGVRLEQLLWVRCRNIDQALRATDLILHGGGFALVVLDLGNILPEVIRHVPLAVWFRFRRAVEHTPTIFLVLEQEPHAKTCASLVLRMETEQPHWAKVGCHRFLRSPHACLFAGSLLRAEMVRSRVQPESMGWPNRASPAVILESKYHPIG